MRPQHARNAIMSNERVKPSPLETCILIVSAGRPLGLHWDCEAPSIPLEARMIAARKPTVLFKGQQRVCVSIHPSVSPWQKIIHLQSLAPVNSEHS